MNSRIVIFLSGVLAGAGLAWLFLACVPWHPGKAQRQSSVAQGTITNEQIRKLEEERSSAPPRARKPDSGRSQVGLHRQEISEPSAPPLGLSEADASETNRFEVAMALSRQANRDLLVEGRLLQLKHRLQLTPEQQQVARELLGRRFADPRRAGEFNVEFPGILAQEQQESWQQMQREDQQRGVEDNAWNWAVQELGRMQSTLGVTRAQQEKALPILYQSGLEMGEALNRHESDAPNWPVRLQRDLQALKQVLTDEQFAIWEKYQQQMLKSNQMIAEEAP